MSYLYSFHSFPKYLSHPSVDLVLVPTLMGLTDK